MSKDLNQCNFIGRLGKDPELRFSKDSKAVSKFSIACGDDYKGSQNQKVEQTNWISVVAFGKLAEIVGEYLKKGSRIYISGKQVTRKWQDQQTGQDRFSTEIVASEMQMLDSRGAGSSNDGAQGSHQQSAPPNQQMQGGTMAPQNAPPPHNDGAQGAAFDNSFDDDIPF